MRKRIKPSLPAPVTVAPQVWARLPGLVLVVVRVSGLDNTRELPIFARALAERQAMLRSGWPYPTAASHPHLVLWREAMRAIGVKPGKKPASIEALIKRALGEQPLASINPLVDLYHLVSLRHLIPAGAWDAETLRAPLALRFTRGDERFRALGSDDVVEIVSPGELAYVTGHEVVTRHFVWRQSELGKIILETTRAILVAEIPAGRAPNLAGLVRDTFVSLLTEHFGATAEVWIVRE